jgi:cell filamentation protein, protein adenylyltransferase
VLKQVEVLLTEGRAVGARELSEYNEVRGYADEAEWVYQAITPGEWSEGEHLTLAELRQVHTTAMTPVWDVAPHPDASEREGPGSFREHEIRPYDPRSLALAALR